MNPGTLIDRERPGWDVELPPGVERHPLEWYVKRALAREAKRLGSAVVIQDYGFDLTARPSCPPPS